MDSDTGQLMGRPAIEIDWAKVEELCSLQCTQEEIAAELGICADTLQNACKRDHSSDFSAYFGQKRKKGFVSLRRKQYEVATSGNPTMLIWLGKQHLNQSDKVENTVKTDRLDEVLAALKE